MVRVCALICPLLMIVLGVFRRQKRQLITITASLLRFVCVMSVSRCSRVSMISLLVCTWRFAEVFCSPSAYKYATV